jgi:hypothetical protein
MDERAGCSGQLGQAGPAREAPAKEAPLPSSSQLCASLSIARLNCSTESFSLQSNKMTHSQQEYGHTTRVRFNHFGARTVRDPSHRATSRAQGTSRRLSPISWDWLLSVIWRRLSCVDIAHKIIGRGEIASPDHRARVLKQRAKARKTEKKLQATRKSSPLIPSTCQERAQVALIGPSSRWRQWCSPST